MKQGKLYAALGVTLVMAATAVPAAAQVCQGYPTAPGQTGIGLRASFPTGGTLFGVEAGRNWMNPLGVVANLNLQVPDDDDADNVPVAGVAFAYELAEFVPAIPTWLSVCPVAGISVGFGDATEFRVPLGVGFGASYGTPDGFAIQPFVRPQFVLTRISIDDIDVNDNNFGIAFGAFAKFSGVYGGVTLGKDFISGSDLDVMIQGGLVFPARLP